VHENVKVASAFSRRVLEGRLNEWLACLRGPSLFATAFDTSEGARVDHVSQDVQDVLLECGGTVAEMRDLVLELSMIPQTVLALRGIVTRQALAQRRGFGVEALLNACLSEWFRASSRVEGLAAEQAGDTAQKVRITHLVKESTRLLTKVEELKSGEDWVVKAFDLEIALLKQKLGNVAESIKVEASTAAVAEYKQKRGKMWDGFNVSVWDNFDLKFAEKACQALNELLTASFFRAKCNQDDLFQSLVGSGRLQRSRFERGNVLGDLVTHTVEYQEGFFEWAVTAEANFAKRFEDSIVNHKDKIVERTVALMRQEVGGWKQVWELRRQGLLAEAREKSLTATREAEREMRPRDITADLIQAKSKQKQWFDMYGKVYAVACNYVFDERLSRDWGEQ
jgi:hypothetical protein